MQQMPRKIDGGSRVEIYAMMRYSPNCLRVEVLMRIVTTLLGLVLSVNAVEIHVSPDGSDKHPGTEQSPLLTLAKAREAARAAGGPSKVVLHEGTYRLEASLELDERDSNTMWLAAKGADVRISGGIQIPVDELNPVKDAKVLERLPEASRGKVVELALPGKGSGGSEAWPLRFRGYAGWPEVYIDGRAMNLARWPNEGYAMIAKVLDKGSQPRNGEKPDRGGAFLFKESAPGTWRSDEPIYLGGYWCHKWYDEFVRVESIDAAKKQIKMAAPHHYGLGGNSKGLYFAINLLEELDQPGEYVYDGKRNMLYLFLPNDAQGSLHVASLSETLLVAKKVKNLELSGLTFENGCLNAIDLTDCESVRVTGCTIRQFSGSGVVVSDGLDCGIDACHIYNLGKSGARLSGGDRQTLTPSKHFVTNTRIHHFARLVQTYCPAVGINGVGQTVSNNHFHDAPHCAVQFGGNDHQITFNHIERVCQDTADAGAIYCGRDWTLGGNRVHGNFIHDLGAASTHGNWGVYLDDMASGIEVSSNIVMNTASGVLVGGGRNNMIVGNVFINCPKRSIRYDARGTGWVSKSRSWLDKPDGTMWKRLSALPYQAGVWNERFPYLAEIETDAYKEPRNSVVSGNMVFKSPALNLDKLVTQHGTVEGNATHVAAPELLLEGGRLKASDENLKPFHGIAVGPAAR